MNVHEWFINAFILVYSWTFMLFLLGDGNFISRLQKAVEVSGGESDDVVSGGGKHIGDGGGNLVDGGGGLVGLDEQVVGWGGE